MHHFGSGICSQMRLSTGDIFKVTVPATIMRSDWRGMGRNTSAPNRAMSKRDVVLAIISIAQQASPKVSGQSADLRAQLKTWSTVVMMKFFSNLFSIYPINQFAARARSMVLPHCYSDYTPPQRLFLNYSAPV